MAHLAAAGDGSIYPTTQSWLNAAIRVAVWVAPISLLLSLVELSPRYEDRMSIICHALADPIDLTWCLIHKLSTWTECYSLAAEFVQREHPADDYGRKTRVIATVFAGVDEIIGPGRSTRRSLLGVAAQLGANDPKRFPVWHRTALELVDSRKHDVQFPLLAVALYVLQLFAAVIPGFSLDGVSSPVTPAAALLVSWLVPVALLSGRMGAFRSRRVSLDAVRRFVDETAAENAKAKDESTSNDITFRLCRTDRITYMHLSQQNSSIDIYRPWKARCVNRRYGESTIPATAVMAAIPVALSATSSLILSWISIPGRSVYQQSLPLALFAAWILSAFLSGIIYFRINHEHQWRAMIAKDVLIGVPTVFFTILSIVNLSEKSDCWVWPFDVAGAVMPKSVGDPQHQGNESQKVTYMFVLVSCIGFQLLFHAAVLRIYWTGLMVMQWPEKTRREEFAWLEDTLEDSGTRFFWAWT
jgi:hypothetical protein